MDGGWRCRIIRIERIDFSLEVFHLRVTCPGTPRRVAKRLHACLRVESFITFMVSTPMPATRYHKSLSALSAFLPFASILPSFKALRSRGQHAKRWVGSQQQPGSAGEQIQTITQSSQIRIQFQLQQSNPTNEH